MSTHDPVVGEAGRALVRAVDRADGDHSGLASRRLGCRRLRLELPAATDTATPRRTRPRGRRVEGRHPRGLVESDMLTIAGDWWWAATQSSPARTSEDEPRALAVEHPDRVHGGALGDAPAGAGGRAGDVGAVTVAVTPRAGVGPGQQAADEVAARPHPAAQLLVAREPGVDDVDVGAGAGAVRVLVATVEPAARLVGAIQAPARARSVSAACDGDVGRDRRHHRVARSSGDRGGRKRAAKPRRARVVGQGDHARRVGDQRTGQRGHRAARRARRRSHGGRRRTPRAVAAGLGRRQGRPAPASAIPNMARLDAARQIVVSIVRRSSHHARTTTRRRQSYARAAATASCSSGESCCSLVQAEMFLA